MAAFEVLLLVLCITFVIFKRVASKRKYRDIERIPGPKPIPVLGNVLEFGTSIADIFENQHRLFETYGPFMRVWLGGTLKLLIADPVKAEFFLSSSKHIRKSYLYDLLKPWLSNGLVISTGDYWRKHRKLITPTFHFKILEGSTDFMNSNSIVLLEKLTKEVGKKSFNVYPFINLYALDVICETAMRTTLNAQLGGNTDYVKAVKQYLNIFYRRAFSLFKRYDFFFQFTSDYKLQEQTVKTLHDFTEGVIKKRKQNRLNTTSDTKEVDSFGIKKRSAFLDLLLDLENEGAKFSDEELREEVDTFMFAGHDTISSAISFCLLNLSQHPEVQEKLFKESQEVIGTDKNAEITLSHITELKYLELVVKESMRLHTPIPQFERELEEDVMFDGMLIPKGTLIQITAYEMHRNAKLYPDPLKYDPDRFLPENCKDRHAYAYIPFSAGPRNCIGQKYAMISAKLAISKVVRNFEILPSEPRIEPRLLSNGILESSNGINIQLKMR